MSLYKYIFIMTTIDVKCCDGLELLNLHENGSIDLILTDPPYIISRESGMNTHYNNVQENEANNVEFVKSEEEWNEYKFLNCIDTDDAKSNFMKYGTIYGKKYCVKTDYGEWDSNFTMETLESFIESFYNKLRNGGTLIIWFDLWKISQLKELLEKHKFKQIRMIEWIKTNPQPLNSKTNYLTNCREIALTAVKKGKPTFNSKYDNGIYSFPLQGGKNRFHPTQKSLELFKTLIKKHSNAGDLIVDPFLGAGTTAIASKLMGRKCNGSELNESYINKMNTILEQTEEINEEEGSS